MPNSYRICDEIVEVLEADVDSELPVRELYAKVQANLDINDWKPVKSARVTLAKHGVVKVFQQGKVWFITLTPDHTEAYDAFLATQASASAIKDFPPIRSKTRLPAKDYFPYVNALSQGKVEMIFVPRGATVIVNGEEL